VGWWLKILCIVAAVAVAVGTPAVPATAQDRVALVIGNSNYRNAPSLSNPVNDADAFGLFLKNAGFAIVETQHDLGIEEMRRVIRNFSELARKADVAVVYYAGHGLEVDGNNYLVPVDAILHRDIDVEDETVSLNRILQVIEPAKRLRLVILDACRDNPFARAMKRTMATRSIGRGLASVEPTTSNTLIAFAAKGGSTADDGGGLHSPFTTALLNNLATPGLDLRIAFGRVRDDVLKATGNRQEPFVYGSLGGTEVALVSAPKADAGGGAAVLLADPAATRRGAITMRPQRSEQRRRGAHSSRRIQLDFTAISPLLSAPSSTLLNRLKKCRRQRVCLTIAGKAPFCRLRKRDVRRLLRLGAACKKCRNALNIQQII
jgi:hypothetical protein